MIPLAALFAVAAVLLCHVEAVAIPKEYKLDVGTPWNCNQTVNYVDRAKIFFEGTTDSGATFDLYATNVECYKCSKSLLAYGSVGALGDGSFNCGLLW
jgi:hypothetical protein